MSQALLKAAALATEYHCFHPLTPANAFRKSKLTGVQAPYVIHVYDVLKLLIKWGITDLITLVAGVDHDLTEDTTITYEELVVRIGKEAADVVMELTFHPSEGADSKQKSEEKANKMLSFKTASIRAFVIKIADRLKNVMDFYDGGDRGYAVTYLHKADVLWDNLDVRRQEIIDLYGEQVYKNIHASVTSVFDFITVGGHAPSL